MGSLQIVHSKYNKWWLNTKFAFFKSHKAALLRQRFCSASETALVEQLF